MSLRKEELERKIIELGISLDEDIKWDNTKLIRKLGDYYMPENATWGQKYMQSMETVMLCKHMKDEIKNFKVSPLEADEYVAEYKCNGARCLHKSSMILCDDGVQRTIKDIVDNKLEVNVLSYNEKTGESEFKPVTNWLINGKKTRSNWVIIGGKPNLAKKLIVTKDHKVFTKNRGYVEAQYITPEDELSIKYIGCNETQKQVLLGLFLGDGCIQEEKRTVGRTSYRLGVAHSEKQLPYLQIIHNVFNTLSHKITSYISGYGSKCYRFTTSPMLDINKYIGSTKKVITRELLNQVDWLGLAVWYMDDGSLCANNAMNPKISNKECRASLALCRYSDEECLLVQQHLLKKYNINSNLVNIKNNMKILVVDSKSSPIFFKGISKYIPKCMDYKVPPEYRDNSCIEWWNDNKFIISDVFSTGFTVHDHYHLDPNKEKAGRGMVCYDIEVADNHNFYANNILVHNCLISYDPEEGFTFLSRKESVTNFLNNNFTPKILFINNGIVTKPEDYKGKFNVRFVLDGEITVDSPDGSNETDFEGAHYDNVEDFLQAVLGSLPARAQNFQLNGHALRFNIFDCLYYENKPEGKAPEMQFDYSDKELTKEEIAWVEAHYMQYLTTAGFTLGKRIPKLLYRYLYDLRKAPKHDLRRLPFYKRRQVRKVLVDYLRKANLPFVEVEGEDVNKVSYLEEVLAEGSEGIVLKHLDAPYISALKSSRSHKACMKVKQSVKELMENSNKFDDFDVFITGANAPKSDRITDMIGSLSCSIYMIDELGETVLHEIANVSGIPHEWKRELAQIGEDEKITLNPKYLNKVIAIDGMALSHNSLRFQHAVLKEKNGLVFKDKNPTDCVWEQSELEKMIIVRGKYI